MAISIDWGTRVINIPRVDLTLIQANPEIRELQLNNFRLDLKDLEDGEIGMPFPDTHRHNTEVSISGITLARVIEIINGYTITFEDGQYAVNLKGANSNVGDNVNVNQVSIRSFNSAGLVSGASGGDWSAEDKKQIRDALGITGVKEPAIGGQIQTIQDMITLLNNVSITDINNQVCDVLKVDTIDEMVPGSPPAPPTMEQVLNYLYVRLRNKNEQTSSEHSVYDDTGTTKLFKAGVSDNGTTFTKEKYESG